MSRSRRKVPCGSRSCRGDHPGVEKSFKQKAHRALRKAVRDAIRNGEFDHLPHDREFGDPWCGPKDGKCGWPRGGLKRCDPRWFRK